MVADLDRLPYDGRRYELLDGGLIVSPRPGMVHQFVGGRLFLALNSACPVDLCVMYEPGVELGPTWSRVAGVAEASWNAAVAALNKTISPAADPVARMLGGTADLAAALPGR